MHKNKQRKHVNRGMSTFLLKKSSIIEVDKEIQLQAFS